MATVCEVASDESGSWSETRLVVLILGSTRRLLVEG